jgi:hypothetical protein
MPNPEPTIPHERVFCFLDKDRECGADCLAYKTVPEQNTELDTLQPHCALIDNVSRGARALWIVAAVAGDWIKGLRRYEADKARAESVKTTVPDPMGGKK